MFKFLYSNLKKGINKIFGNSQLIYTIVVASVITISFIFMSQRFINIANDAQERLINVRIGALQDAFVSFAGDRINDPLYLNNKIKEIMSTNETIKSFNIIKKETSLDLNTNKNIISYKIISSDKSEEIGNTDEQVSFLYTLASSDTAHSITIAMI